MTLKRLENDVKRLTLTLIAGALLAAALGGCVIAPAPGYYGGGYYHHGYYYVKATRALRMAAGRSPQTTDTSGREAGRPAVSAAETCAT